MIKKNIRTNQTLYQGFIYRFIFQSILTLLYFLWLAMHVNMAHAQKKISFIRDTEIENTIRLYSQSIFQAAELNSTSVKIYIIKNNQLNAFVTNGQKIFLHTGLLTTATTPEQVMGVIAHEVGHITGGHLAKVTDKLEDANAMAIASMIIGVPLAIATGRADIGLAATSLGLTTAERDFLAYSRAHEQAADQAGVEFMNKSGVDPAGLYEFMKTLNNQSKLYQSGTPNPYMLTHPLTTERMDFLEFSARESSHNGKKLPAYFYKLHERMRVKLKAFLLPSEESFLSYPPSDLSDQAHYARAIAYQKIAKWQDALHQIAFLRQAYPQDPFYMELEGDIHLEAGDFAAAAFAYDQALALLPWAGLIHIMKAKALVAMEDRSLEEQAIKHLETARAYEPNRRELWRNLGIIYERRNDQAMLAYVLAEVSLAGRDLRRAKIQAEKAINLLPRDSSAWQRARDILNQVSNLQN